MRHSCPFLPNRTLMVRTSDHDKAHVGAGEHVGQMLGSVRDCRQSLFGPSADRVHDHVEYSLTEVSESLRPIIEAMKTWGEPLSRRTRVLIFPVTGGVVSC